MESQKSSLEEQTPKSRESASKKHFSLCLDEINMATCNKQNNIDTPSIFVQKKNNKNRTYHQNNSEEPVKSTHPDQDIPKQKNRPQQSEVAPAENLLNGFHRYSNHQSECMVIFDEEHESNEDLPKDIENNFDGKMTTEMKFFESLNLLLSKSKMNVITLEMLQEAARMAGPDVRIIFERARDQSSSVENGYSNGQSGCVIIFADDHESNKNLAKAIRNNFDRKMTTEIQFFKCLNLLISKSKRNVITLEMLQKAARMAGSDVRIIFERARGQNSSVEYRYSNDQSGCAINFDEGPESKEDLPKATGNNSGGKMTTERIIFESQNVLFSKPKRNLITLEMLQEAARVAGPDVGNISERARDQSASVVLEYVILLPNDRLFLLIPVIRGGFIHEKEQLYLEEYPRINPNS